MHAASLPFLSSFAVPVSPSGGAIGRIEQRSRSGTVREKKKAESHREKKKKAESLRRATASPQQPPPPPPPPPARSPPPPAPTTLEGRGSVPTRQGPLANSDKTSPLEKEKTCARPSVTVSGLSEDKIRGLSTEGEGCEKNLKCKRSLGTMLNRGNDADRDVKPTGQRSSANEARPGPSDGLAFRCL